MRIAAIVALLVAAAIAVTLIVVRKQPYEISASLINASQLVVGNRVQVAGEEVGEITEIDLTDDGQAKVDMEINPEFAPLREGTQGVVRQLSISGQASRYIDLHLGGADRRTIPNGGEIPAEDAASAVDLDQAFDLLDERTRPNAQRTIKLLSEFGAGKSEQANEALRYLNPALFSSSRLFRELAQDPATLKRFIAETANLTGDLAARDEDLAGLVRNLSATMRALASERDALGESVERLPAVLRRSNTTFVNLRATLDDLDPLVEEAKPVVRNDLRPLFDELRPFARDAAPTLRDLSRTISRSGADNDLVDLLRRQPAVDAIANQSAQRNGAERPGAFAATRAAAAGATPQVGFLRPYAPDLMGWFDDFSTSGMYDALGSFSRAGTAFSGFTVNPGGGILPVPPELRNELFSTNLVRNRNNRCPGAVERRAPDGTNPYRPSADFNCDPRQVPPGR